MDQSRAVLAGMAPSPDNFLDTWDECCLNFLQVEVLPTLFAVLLPCTPCAKEQGRGHGTTESAGKWDEKLPAEQTMQPLQSCGLAAVQVKSLEDFLSEP